MRILLTYSLLLMLAPVFAQPFQGNIKIENITFPEGNQLSYVIDIAQDSTGLIWMRPDWNFYTYNGHNISRVDPVVMGFIPPNTRRFHADNMHRYFYMVRDSLVVYDPVAKKVKKVISQKPGRFPPEISHLTISNLAIEAGGTLWGTAATPVENVNSYIVRSNDLEHFELVDSFPISWYYDAALVKDDHFFVKLRDKVVELDSNGIFKTYQFPDGPDPVMTSMVKDAQNTIWVIHSPDKSKDQYGVYYLKEGANDFVRVPEKRRFPQEEKHGMVYANGHFIWHKGDPFRLSRINVRDGTIEDFTEKIIEQSYNFPFYNSTFLNIFRDQSGEVWLTTRAGVVKMTIEEELFRTFDLGQAGVSCSGESCQIRGIAEDEDGNIYFSHLKGIMKMNPKNGELTTLSLNIPPQPQKTHGLSYAKGTLFWNEYAIDLRTLQSEKLFPSDNYQFLTHGLDPEGNNLWIGVTDIPFRFYHYDIKNKELTQINLPEETFSTLNDEIRQIHFSPTTGTLFLSIWNGGILEIDTTGKILKRYQPTNLAEGWLNLSLYGLYEDEASQLWFGHGTDAGLGKIDLKTGEINTIPYEVNSYTGKLKRVFRILPGQKGQLWLVTEKGTLLLDKNTGVLTRFPMFPSMSEMAFHLLPGFAAKDGNLYLGTPSGTINAFDPGNLVNKARLDQVFPVSILRYDRYNEKRDSIFTQLTDLHKLSEISLTHQDRYFNLEFFVPDYRNTDQNLYTYWLERYDKDWSTPSKINQLQYENLPPGEYTLHIRGGLTPDYYESSERLVKVFVARAWYTTWWAWSLYVLLIGLFGYWLFRFLLGQRMKIAEAKRLKELDGLKSRLYTNITHEFRTPLTVIMGMANNIKGHSQEKQLIQRNSESLLRLINQLLDLSKLDSDMLKLDMIQADIVNYLQYVTESFYSMARDKKIRLTFYPEVKELVMDFDAEKMQHIVYNLLSNAIKFTSEEGKVILHLREVEVKGQRWLQIKVSDTGKGIEEKELPHIFDRFYQVENTGGDSDKEKTYSGTGIGLALSKELVELMGGQIVVESKPGSGTDFMILLPVKNQSEMKEENFVAKSFSTEKKEVFESTAGSPAPAFQWDPTGTEGDRPTLLIIEDNRDVISYIESLLQKDYHIETAQNGQTGIEKALEMIPDIIISDVMMPEKDGYEVCQTLKNDERTSHIPIILLTAKATKEDRIEGLREGADAYLVKPFHQEELFIRLEKLIALRRALQESYSGTDLMYKLTHSGSTSTKTATRPSLDEQFLQKLVQVVQEKINDPDLAVIHLCQAVRLSNSQVNRKLKAVTGKTPSQFIRSIRLQKAMELLKTTDLHVSEIAYRLGFNDPNYFTRAFSEEFGCPPNAIRK